ncbi:hypothetical protein BDV36DRAFT_227956 [Aspergillus pseudocaelatus]|uniref:Uncharacterized protein n=1 Tax=Aspergillus pseudocaelatus TaxID=1825620 RepID=A0ABQ6WD56_9EURO|nr:hypothetical protein BDV36DRAFT_227956 [Aspergillus pseudocaelatus]
MYWISFRKSLLASIAMTRKPPYHLTLCHALAISSSSSFSSFFILPLVLRMTPSLSLATCVFPVNPFVNHG